MNNVAIIVAGGKGDRFGGPRPKQFLELGKVSILERTLSAFQKVSMVDALALLLPSLEVEGHTSLKGKFSKLKWIVAGGLTRQDSTYAGFQAIPRCKIVLVHDVVRPFVSEGVIQQLIAEATQEGACLVGEPCRNTIKEVDGGGMIVKTIDRSRLWQVHTPQAFRYDILKEALEKAAQEKFYGTDEAMLVERLGHPVKVIEGAWASLKVTVPQDLVMAEALLEKEKL